MSPLPKCSVVGCNELSDPCWFVHVGGECYPACDAHGGERIPKERLRPMCGKAHEYVTVVREAVKCDLDPQHQNQHEADTTLSGRICWSDANEKITDAIRIKDLREEVRRYEGRMSSLIVHLFDLRLLFTAVDIAEAQAQAASSERDAAQARVRHLEAALRYCDKKLSDVNAAHPSFYVLDALNIIDAALADGADKHDACAVVGFGCPKCDGADKEGIDAG